MYVNALYFIGKYLVLVQVQTPNVYLLFYHCPYPTFVCAPTPINSIMALNNFLIVYSSIKSETQRLHPDELSTNTPD